MKYMKTTDLDLIRGLNKHIVTSMHCSQFPYMSISICISCYSYTPLYTWVKDHLMVTTRVRWKQLLRLK